MRKVVALLLLAGSLWGQESLGNRVGTLDRLTLLQEIFKSNQTTLAMLQTSNHLWAAPRVEKVLTDNNEIAVALLELTNAYGNDRALQSVLMQQVADWWFEHDRGRRGLAFEVYRRIVMMDLDLIGEAQIDVWEGRTTSLNPGAFTRALAMDRYLLETATADGRAAAEEASWRERYRGWHRVWTNGYMPGAEFRVNMGIFYLFEGDMDRAARILDWDRFEHDAYWRTRLAAENLRRKDGGLAAWRALKEFLGERMMWDALRVSPGPVDFRRAMDSLSVQDALGRRLPPRFDLLPLTNETVLETVLQGLDRAAEDPVAAALSRYNQGLIFLALERWPQAVRSLEAAVARSTDPRIYKALALAELKLGNGARALAWYLELSRVDPTLLQRDGFFLNNMATAAVGTADLETKRLALARINRAVELDDRNPVFHTTRGEVLRSLGDFREGTNALKRAGNLLPLADGEGLTNAMRWFDLPETNRAPSLVKELAERIEKLLGGAFGTNK